MARSRKHDVDEIAFNGRATVKGQPGTTGVTNDDEVVAVVTGPFRAFEDVRRQQGGLVTVGKVTTGEIMVLTGEEADEFRERLQEQRRVRGDNVNPEQGGLSSGLGEDYEAWQFRDLQAECKNRDVNAKGSRAELIERLRESERLEE